MKKSFFKEIKSSLYFFVIFFLIIIISKNVNFFKKTYTIFYNDINDRKVAAYDFCDFSGNGYIFYLKKNFEFKATPIIKSNFKKQNKNWIFNHFGENLDETKIIILNKYDNDEISLDLNKYKILDNFQNRCMLLEKI
tara:strand:+ start:1337 stop:1747 length:411 start_codon:yes stop_codon:yes gene_type:complete